MRGVIFMFTVYTMLLRIEEEQLTAMWNYTYYT